MAWEWDHYMYGTCTDYWQYNLVLVLITKSKKSKLLVTAIFGKISLVVVFNETIMTH